MRETRQKILEAARRLFNERGLANVGVRDVARAAKLSPGNLVYHFATRDALVAALVEELVARNRDEVFTMPMERFSLVELYRAATGTMRNMLDYRFVLLSYVEAVQSSPELGKTEAEMAPLRRERHDAMLGALIANGFVERATLRRSDTIYEQGMLISRGWLTAGMLRGWPDERSVRHFAKLGVALLEPHTTDAGARQMRRIMKGELDEAQR